MAIAFEYWSRTVAVSATVLAPSAVCEFGEATRVLVVVLALPAVAVTVVVTLPLPLPRLAVMVFVCAVVLRSVVCAMPFALVAPVVEANVSPVPELASVMFAPCTRLA